MDTRKLPKYISDWIFNYTNNMPKKAKALVVGISGGIASSVTSTLCAMTGLKTIVLSMPINQIKVQHDLSLKHLNWLTSKFNNVEGHLINLDSVFQSFKQSSSIFNNEYGLANSKARLRMTTLYQAAAAKYIKSNYKC